MARTRSTCHPCQCRPHARFVHLHRFRPFASPTELTSLHDPATRTHRKQSIQKQARTGGPPTAGSRPSSSSVRSENSSPRPPESCSTPPAGSRIENMDGLSAATPGQIPFESAPMTTFTTQSATALLYRCRPLQKIKARSEMLHHGIHHAVDPIAVQRDVLLPCARPALCVPAHRKYFNALAQTPNSTRVARTLRQPNA